ncbi:MAG TPA: response regulator, partial [Spirochaetia bacterium]|nr:response regulator [Spirochaetia bacterium]
MGYRPIGPIATGSGALAILQDQTVDLVLMDIKLKGKMDGIELAKRINAIRPLPIVFLTAYTDERTLTRAKVTEPFGYITKSFDDGELHSTIEMALYKFKVEQRLVKNERLLSSTLGNIVEGIVTTDSQGRVRYMNPASSKLLGIPFEEANGKKLQLLLSLRSSDGRSLSPFEIEKLTEAQERHEDLNNLTLKRKDGTEFPVEWKTTRAVSVGNKEVETVHVVRDVSARMKAEVAQRKLVSLVEFSDDAIITLS